ncbi:MAG: hypothetical protein KGJ80_03935 [Chloroflexota bacterium]|nr:hypothetical protein [Chloroflexota bacterium]
MPNFAGFTRDRTIYSALTQTFWLSETAVMTTLAALIGVGAGLGVDRRNPRQLIGLLRRSDIVYPYSHALVDKQQREHHVARLRLESLTGTEFVEIDLRREDASVGKQLKELTLPNDCVIVAIERGGQVVVPRGNTELLAGDRIVAMSGATASENLHSILKKGSNAASAEEGESPYSE